MPATARQIPLTGEDLERQGGGAYAALEVPNDYVAVLADVNDYDKRAKGGSQGWVFHYEIDPGTGKPLGFDVYLSFSKAARWKLVQTLEAHEVDLSEGVNNVDPNLLIGEEVGAHVDFPEDYYEAINRGENVKGYREIRYLFVLAPEEPFAEGSDDVEVEAAPAPPDEDPFSAEGAEAPALIE